MSDSADRIVAVVGVGALLPDAPDAKSFWRNIQQGRYCVSEVSPERWDPAIYYDSDPKAPDRTYSKIGGWVRDWEWDPLAWRLPIPPRVAESMDLAQKWAVVATREALLDYGYPDRPLDQERTAVILGNAMAGDTHLYSSARVLFQEYERDLAHVPEFAALPDALRRDILARFGERVRRKLPTITEDTMPGELANIVAGRVAAVYDLKGPNFVADAACASAMAGFSAALEGLIQRHYDAVLTGGIDANMNPATFVKFCKIGALSATGTRPYAEGADGFVMGEGAAVFLMKRLADAERDSDRIYALVRGVGGSSDGKGKGITAPNPVGQRLAVRRAWEIAGVAPTAGDLVEGHGTSTRVGDVVEVESIAESFRPFGLPAGSLALGSVKSNIGHLKGAAGAAGMLKAVFALHEKVLPPSVNFTTPNPGIDFASSPFRVNTEARPWEKEAGTPRRACVSAFGFGGTNFHVVLEEYVPGRIRTDSKRSVSVPAAVTGTTIPRTPPRGALVLGGESEAEIVGRLRRVATEAASGRAPTPGPPSERDLRASLRLALDYGTAAELADKAEKALKAFEENDAGRWKALRAKGIFLGKGPAPKVAFLFSGQGSQYVNMLRELRDSEPVVAETYRRADEVMQPLLGKPLSECIFRDETDERAIAEAEQGLKQTAITQPAVLSAETALSRLLATYGIVPDMVMGHSLGEYGALVAAGALSFEEALRAVSARGTEMTRCAVEDSGTMAAVLGPVDRIAEILEGVDGYVVVANLNSTKEAVIGGATAAVERGIEAVRAAGYRAQPIQVSHAFHTAIVAPASEGLSRVLRTMQVHPPEIPVVANVSGEFYPMGPGVVPEMIEILGKQVASPVQFVKGLRTLYDAGARVFVEVGPKRILYGFVDDVLGERDGVWSLFTNHPRIGDIVSFNLALCGLYAAGLGVGAPAAEERPAPIETPAPVPARGPALVPRPSASASTGDRYAELGRMFVEFLDRSYQVYTGGQPAPAEVEAVITGAAMGLPGVDRVFDDTNVERILRGDQFIEPIPQDLRRAMLEKNVTRLVKSETGEGRFETIGSLDEVIKLAARARAYDLVRDFGFPEDRLPALDHVTKLAIGAGIDALRDAGIPLVLRYKTTTKGTLLPDRFMLPEELRDDTGVIFGSAFPGYDAFAGIMSEYYEDRIRRAKLEELQSARASAAAAGAPVPALADLDARIARLRAEVDAKPYRFDRRFLFRVLSMGHAQFAEYIGARGPNTAVNAACATGTQAIGLARDWIASGRCRRVVVLTADDITSDDLLGWHGAGFLASGAAATDERVEDAALPFDRRRHGLLIGMGAAAVVVESAEAARERGIRPICEVLGAVTANSAFHGTRLDVGHICQVMETMLADVERRRGIRRADIAPEMVFVSHETYTPARGGSASAEVFALRQAFGPTADRIVVANTKGATGHPMGVAIEDVVAIKILETGIVPPVPNFREEDPELGLLNLSKGGSYPVRYALRLGAGFGSQIAMTLLRWVPSPDGRRPRPSALGFSHRIEDPAAWSAWLARVTGQAAPQIEVVQRTLRVKDVGAAARATASVPAPSEHATSSSTPAPPPPAEIAVPVADPVQETVLRIIAEKTGYPPDMLQLDLDLEADLGIDTVKQAEMFAAIRAAWEIPRDDNLKLRDYPTLAHAIQFVYDRRPDLKRAPAPVPVAAAPAPTAQPQPPAAAAPSAAADPVREAVIRIIAEKTGYPPDMLDLDLDLEADLGIDTVKQAEMFAAIRAAWEIPRDDDLKLRDYPTLGHAIQFVYDRRPDLKRAPAASAAPASPPPAPAPAGDSSRAATLAAAAAVPRRVPVPCLRPALKFCAPTGVDLGRGSRVVLMPDAGGVGKALSERLVKLGVEVLAIEGAPVARELVERIEGWLEQGSVHGVFWLPALDAEPELSALDQAAWREANRVRTKLLYTAMRALYGAIGARGTFLVSATRLGGLHGYDDAGAQAPLGGGVTGFTKAFHREKGEALVKALDFEPSRKTTALADLLLEEVRFDPGAVEIGYRGGRRFTVGLEERPAADGQPGMTLGRDTVFVITGAAGSIVSAITADLAAASGGTFHLLDLTPAPDPASEDLRRFATDREGLKRELFERGKAHGERVTPAVIERQMASLERLAAARAAIDAVGQAGGTAHYWSVDLRDPSAVARVMGEVVARHGRVDVLIHAAGLEISRLLPDKSPEEFDLVFDVKADGWFHLLSGLGAAPLGAAVAFSSVAGRFGNTGQTDYSAANDLTCKLVSSFRRTRPATRGIAIDWTAWGGIGMATRGSIPAVLEKAGIDMLPPEAGIPVVRRELTAGGTRGEIVVAGRLGMMMAELDSTGGLDVGEQGALARLAARGGPMLGRVTGMGVHTGLTVETDLDPTRQPFLFDHRISGTPVLPGVMGVEALAEAAMLLFPDLTLGAIENVSFLVPFKFHRDQPRKVIVQAQLRIEGEGVIARCRLIGARTLHGKSEPEITTHFTSSVRMVPALAAGDGRDRVPPPGKGKKISAADIYRIYFHGPAYQVVDSAWKSGDEIVGQLAAPLPANHEPADLPLLAAPRLVELCFQTAGLAELAQEARMGLPSGVGRIELLRDPGEAGSRIFAAVSRRPGGGFDGRVVDENGDVILRFENYRTMQVPDAVDPTLMKPLKDVLA